MCVKFHENWLRIDLRNYRKSFTTVNVNPTILTVTVSVIGHTHNIANHVFRHLKYIYCLKKNCCTFIQLSFIQLTF